MMKFLLLLTLLIVSSRCKKESISDYTYYIPEASDDGWEVGPSDESGISSVALAKMMGRINSTSGHNIHSILIFRNGKLVFEEYFEGYLYSGNPPGSNGMFIQYDRETDHFLASVSKSITSVLFGVAIQEGFIGNINDKVFDILPEYSDVLPGAKAEITLEQLLTMSSGLAWDESSASYGDPANDVTALFESDDPLAYVLSKPLLYSPGTQFHYNSGGTTEWWLKDFQSNGHTYNSFLAAGWGDQYMIIFPAEELIIVLNGGNFLSAGSISPHTLVTDYILVALK